MNPPSFTFSLNPGEAFDQEIEIEIPYSSVAGAKTIGAEFSLPGEPTPHFTVPVAASLGLSDVGMQTLALRDGEDVVVQQMVTNYGEQPINYGAFAIFPGQARQERLVTNLGPGRTAVKRYRFAAAQGGAPVEVARGGEGAGGDADLERRGAGAVTPLAREARNPKHEIRNKCKAQRRKR